MTTATATAAGDAPQSERKCRACGCPLIFAEGANGRMIPLDKRAPVYEVKDGKAIRVIAYVTHFASCPKAGDFSKGGKK